MIPKSMMTFRKLSLGLMGVALFLGCSSSDRERPMVDNQESAVIEQPFTSGALVVEGGESQDQHQSSAVYSNEAVTESSVEVSEKKPHRQQGKSKSPVYSNEVENGVDDDF